ncbi:MAG TPA: hypothetical protein VIV11_23165 [Kofleriaceae bacterium]
MRILAGLGLLAACTVDIGSSLRVEPEFLELSVPLDEHTRVPLRVFSDDNDVTAEVRLSLDGAPLGTVDPTGFTSDGRTGGTATIVATLAGAEARVPVHVRLHSTRFVEISPDIAPWFETATESAFDAALEPGDGAVIPPNLGRLDVHFTAIAPDDLHQVSVASPDLDIRVYARSTGAARQIDLTPAEWDAISRTARGGTAELAVRSLTSTAPTDMRTARAQLGVAELPFPAEVLFTGRPGEDMPQLWSYSLTATATEPWANSPALPCMGCHLAKSPDGKRFAIAGQAILDATTRYVSVPPSPAIGTWTGAVFDPSGLLVTSQDGKLTVRDGTTAVPMTTLTPPLPANQPAISQDGSALVYGAGDIDVDAKIPFTQELRIHDDWNAAALTLGSPRVLVPKTEGEYVKLPDFSSDARWVIYTRVPALFRAVGTVMLVRADGSAAPLELVHDVDFARFATPITVARSGGVAEPMAWLVVNAERPVGVRSQIGIRQLWVVAFYPERGVASRPVYLSGQRADVAVLHAPIMNDGPATN